MGLRSSRLILALCLALTGKAAFAVCVPDQVEIRIASGQIQRFTVEVADDPAERSKGLMFRDSMAMSSGMIFVFPEPKHATFWMKNTPLALDILFADATGTVTHVHENAEPQSEALIDGGPGVAFVVEINGGLAAPMGITTGAVLRHPAIGVAAIWPCTAP